jgi:hypothetical protein
MDPPNIIKGINPKATRLNLQENVNPKIIPHVIANNDSIITAIPSVLTPFRT